jgi:hypothetical protein
MVSAWFLIPARRESLPSFPKPRPVPHWTVDPSHAREYRDRALRAARVWQPVDPRAADFSKNPPDPSGLLSAPLVQCRYIAKHAGGTTPKFDCVLPDGETIRVKYGQTKEINAEVAATRLLTALGFGTDRVYLIPRLRCYGCAREPYYTTRALDYVHARDIAAKALPDEGYTDFDWVAVERHFEGVTIEAEEDQGWTWFELRDADAARGARVAERDALRLAAMLVAHWDNKASNQRLVCRDAGTRGPCERPFAIIQDLGSTFGPVRVDLDAWTAAPIWKDRTRCVLSMKMLPYDGATFPDVTISEAGRRLLARHLTLLTEAQKISLFEAARFPEADGGDPARAAAWASVLSRKIREISEGAPCLSRAR